MCVRKNDLKTVSGLDWSRRNMKQYQLLAAPTVIWGEVARESVGDGTREVAGQCRSFGLRQNWLVLAEAGCGRWGREPGTTAGPGSSWGDWQIMGPVITEGHSRGGGGLGWGRGLRVLGLREECTTAARQCSPCTVSGSCPSWRLCGSLARGAPGGMHSRGVSTHLGCPGFTADPHGPCGPDWTRGAPLIFSFLSTGPGEKGGGERSERGMKPFPDSVLRAPQTCPSPQAWLFPVTWYFSFLFCLYPLLSAQLSTSRDTERNSVILWPSPSQFSGYSLLCPQGACSLSRDPPENTSHVNV